MNCGSNKAKAGSLDEAIYFSRYNKVFRVRDDLIVLYNAITSAIDVLDTDVLSVDIDWRSPGNEELLAYLSDRGYVYRDEAAERRKVDELYAGYLRFKREIRPLIFYLVLTYRCDLACDYCFQRSVKSLDGTLDVEHLPAIFNAIDEIRGHFPETRTRPVVALFGGEPLLRRNLSLVSRIFVEVAERGWVNGPIISNGVSLDAYLPMFEKQPPSGIQVTIDGPREIHNLRRRFANGAGTFDRIVENVDRALDRGLKMGIRSNLDDRNVAFLPEIVALAEEHGWVDNEKVQLSLSPVHDRACGSCHQQIRHDAIFESVLSNLRRLPQLRKWSLDGWSSVNHFRRLLHSERPFLPRFDHCEAVVGKSFHLDGYGNIYSCIEACGMPHLAAGRYLPELAFNERYEAMRDRSVLDMEGCHGCGYTMVCGGGCPLQATFDGRDIRSPSCANTNATVTRYVHQHYGS